MRKQWVFFFGKFGLLLLVLLFLACSNGSEGGSGDGGEVVAPDQQSGDAGPAGAFKCGNGTCPNADYQCCQTNKDAPPVCCLKSAAKCYGNMFAIGGWPVYNGCNPQTCQGERSKFCKGGTRNTCCRATEECGESFGFAYCKATTCTEKRKCYEGRLCCTKPGVCKDYKNVQYCDEDCASQGLEKCSIKGSYYGKQAFHICCPKGQCHIHPDGWPYCLNDQF